MAKRLAHKRLSEQRHERIARFTDSHRQLEEDQKSRYFQSQLEAGSKKAKRLQDRMQEFRLNKSLRAQTSACKVEQALAQLDY
jgi:hypothetical protein